MVAGVAGTGDLAGLDLEVRHRVGLAAVGENQVAVLLVGLDALGDLADQHVADPDRVRALALQRALVVDVALGVRRVVVDEEPVLEVLAGVGEVEPEHLGRAARAGVLDRGVEPHDVAAEGDGDVPERGVAADAACWLAWWTASSSQSCSDEGELRAVADDDLDVVGERRRAGERSTTRSPCCAADLDTQVRGRRRRRARTGHGDETARRPRPRPGRHDQRCLRRPASARAATRSRGNRAATRREVVAGRPARRSRPRARRHSTR